MKIQLHFIYPNASNVIVISRCRFDLTNPSNSKQEQQKKYENTIFHYWIIEESTQILGLTDIMLTK